MIPTESQTAYVSSPHIRSGWKSSATTVYTAYLESALKSALKVPSRETLEISFGEITVRFTLWTSSGISSLHRTFAELPSASDTFDAARYQGDISLRSRLPISLLRRHEEDLVEAREYRVSHGDPIDELAGLLDDIIDDPESWQATLEEPYG